MNKNTMLERKEFSNDRLCQNPLEIIEGLESGNYDNLVKRIFKIICRENNFEMPENMDETELRESLLANPKLFSKLLPQLFSENSKLKLIKNIPSQELLENASLLLEENIEKEDESEIISKELIPGSRIDIKNTLENENNDIKDLLENLVSSISKDLLKENIREGQDISSIIEGTRGIVLSEITKYPKPSLAFVRMLIIMIVLMLSGVKVNANNQEQNFQDTLTEYFVKNGIIPNPKYAEGKAEEIMSKISKGRYLQTPDTLSTKNFVNEYMIELHGTNTDSINSGARYLQSLINQVPRMTRIQCLYEYWKNNPGMIPETNYENRWIPFFKENHIYTIGNPPDPTPWWGGTPGGNALQSNYNRKKESGSATLEMMRTLEIRNFQELERRFPDIFHNYVFNAEYVLGENARSHNGELLISTWDEEFQIPKSVRFSETLQGKRVWEIVIHSKGIVAGSYTERNGIVNNGPKNQTIIFEQPQDITLILVEDMNNPGIYESIQATVDRCGNRLNLAYLVVAKPRTGDEKRDILLRERISRNRPPVYDGPHTLTVQEGSWLPGQKFNYSDPDGDQLTFTYEDESGVIVPGQQKRLVLCIWKNPRNTQNSCICE
jgi:hypothetical protein